MDLSRYELKDLILTAWKSEVDAEDVYRKVRDGLKNFMLRGRFEFLADEERKHAAFFREFFTRRFPAEPAELPQTSPVPLPEMRLDRESIPISDILTMAMNAEKAASEFYASMAERFPDDEAAPAEIAAGGEPPASVREMLRYIASMEMGHYRLLEIEEENARDQEQYDLVWDMTHLGP